MNRPSPVPSPRELPRPRVQAYTVEEAAGLLHIGRDKVYYLLRTGQLRSIKIGKSRRYLSAISASHCDQRPIEAGEFAKTCHRIFALT